MKLSNLKSFILRDNILQLNLLLFLLLSISVYAQAPATPVLISPSNGTLSYDTVKVTFVWHAVLSAVSYDLQICSDTSFATSDLSTFSGNIDTTYTMTTGYLDFNQTYYWRLRAKGGTLYSSYSNYFTFTTGTPRNSINDANASIVFDHSNGRISQIIYKGGSNTQLLNTTLNDLNKTGLGRVNNEVTSKLLWWSETAGNYSYTYENGSYGTKTLAILWNANGISVNMAIKLSATKAATISASWMPGGDLGPIHDYILYTDSTDTLTKANLTYPGITTGLYFGNAVLTAMTDDRYNEYFGYYSTVHVPVILTQGLAFGPTITYAASKSPQVINLGFSINNKTNFFNWATEKSINVTFPVAGAKLIDHGKYTVTWESFGVAGNVDIKLSVDGGATYPTTLASSVANNGLHQVTLPNLSVHAKAPLNLCIIQVSGTGAKGYSTVFSIDTIHSDIIGFTNNLTGAPTDQVTAMIYISPAGGDLINAFDIRLQYNTNILSYSGFSADSQLSGWNVDVSNNSPGGYLQIGAFNNNGSPIKSLDTVINLVLAIKSTAKVGTQTPLLINNSSLSVSDTNARPLQVVGNDGTLTLYSRINGFLRYVISKKPIQGSAVINFIDPVLGDTITIGTNSVGFFDISNSLPGRVINLNPINNLPCPSHITDAVNAVDAAKAFLGREGSMIPLSPIQYAVADVNGDGKVNSTDAYAILKISTGELTEAKLGMSNWIFIDSTYNINTGNWSSAPQSISYAPLDSIKNRQTFWGAIRGDVDGSYSLSGVIDKSPTIFGIAGDPNAIEFSIPANMNVRPGDTLSLPLNIKLNGKTVGAFNTSIQFDKSLLHYTGVFNEGSSLPLNKGWFISTNYDSNNKLNIGGADFADVLAPITQDGTIAIFKFVVAQNAQIGDSIQALVSVLTIGDSKLNSLNGNSMSGKVIISNITSINDENINIDYSLAQNYPNPFNPATTIEYSLHKESNVEIDVYNSLGQRAAVLFNGTEKAGYYKIEWNAKNFASGIYFYKIKAGEFSQVKKMILLK